MKKINKYRPNNNFIYSLNYKFDSCSVAGKINGTALELIKKYNDFAKEAQGNGDYINAEIFRQYAEHYRKIVTEINERKAMRNSSDNQQAAENAAPETENDSEAPAKEAAPVEEAAPAIEENQPEENPVAEKKRAFQVIEISAVKEGAEAPAKPKRTYRKKSVG